MLEYAIELIFRAEQSDALASIAHARFQDPPFPIICVLTFIPCKQIMKLIGFDESFIKEVGVVNFNVNCGRSVVLQLASRIFDKIGLDRVCEKMLPDQHTSWVAVGYYSFGMICELLERD